MTKKWLLGAVLFIPALAQFYPLFTGDFFPFSSNEMYAGRPNAANLSVTYFIGIRDGQKLLSRSDYLEEIYSFLIEQQLEKEQPDFKKICAWLEKDLLDGSKVDSIQIEQKSWQMLTKYNVNNPDSVKVIYECQYP